MKEQPNPASYSDQDSTDDSGSIEEAKQHLAGVIPVIHKIAEKGKNRHAPKGFEWRVNEVIVAYRFPTRAIRVEVSRYQTHYTIDDPRRNDFLSIEGGVGSVFDNRSDSRPMNMEDFVTYQKIVQEVTDAIKNPPSPYPWRANG